jgi:hypothetical protein
LTDKIFIITLSVIILHIDFSTRKYLYAAILWSLFSNTGKNFLKYNGLSSYSNMLLIILYANIKLCINNSRIQINFRWFVYFINKFILFIYSNTICNISDSIIISQRTIVSGCKPFLASIENHLLLLLLLQ